MNLKLVSVAVLIALTSADLENVPDSAAAFVEDDECVGSNAQCAVNALQKKAGRAAPVASSDEEDEESSPKAEPEKEEAEPETTETTKTAGSASPIAPTKDDAAGGIVGDTIKTWKEIDLASGYGGWSWGGDKVWGHGSGTESINGGNVNYYNAGMSTARGRCGHAGCALLTNPVHHRTVNKIHIHEIHYKGYGASLKQKLEDTVCGSPGWHHGHFPCHGQAAFFPGWPGVFSEALEQNANLAHVSVIAWPMSCGGGGTIVELAYHCSIEHQIRGDYNPHYHR